MSRARRLVVELLEDRCVPATFGLPWPDPEHLTLSFTPDGTKVDGEKSQLTQILGATLSTADWQREVLRAFQTWAVHANINWSIVGDNGKPLGTPAPIQGGEGFGDVRIAARPLGAGALAISTPFDLNDTWAGDVLLNSNSLFTRGSQAPHDLFSVMLQEAGHVLGLGNSPDPASPMYDTYLGARRGLTPADVSALQALYGVRSPDSFDAGQEKNSFTTATPVRFASDLNKFRGNDGPGSIQPLVALGDLTSATDLDFYKVTVPSGSNAFTVALKTSGVSLLTARLSVYDFSKKLIHSAVATDPKDGDLTVFVSGVRPGTTYFIKVEKAADDVFGVGAYRLAVGEEVFEALDPAGPSGLLNDDLHSDDSLSGVTALPTRYPTAGAPIDAAYRASISDPADVDWYKVSAPGFPDGSERVLLVTGWALQEGKLDPLVTVHDPQGKELAGLVVVDDGGTSSLQVLGVEAHQAYFLKVRATNPNSSFKEGDYALSVDFRNEALRERTFAAGTLDQTHTQDAGTLTVAESQLFSFRLALDAGGTAVETAIRLTIFDPTGRVVFTLTAQPNSPGFGQVLLGPGSYLVRVAAATKDHSPLPLVRYVLAGSSRSDSIGLELEDTTLAPVGTTPTSSSPYVWCWYPYQYFILWSVEDSYSGPWW